MNKLAILFILLNLPGCSFFHSETKLSSEINASTHLNPDLNNRASPLLLSFYELKNSIPFKNLDFYKISHQAHKSLGSSLIDSTPIEIRPGEKRHYTKKLNADTQYLGIVAAYRHLEISKWKQLIKVPSYTRQMDLIIYLNAQQLQVKPN